MKYLKYPLLLLLIYLYSCASPEHKTDPKKQTEAASLNPAYKYQRNEKGTIVNSVICGADASQSYAIYVFLGCLGIHRVYLGGSWLLILGYIITFGGIFGLLPLIDFIRIVAGGIDHYMGNNALFAAFQGMNY